MGTLAYAGIMLLIFLAGIFIFTYFETPRKTLDKGIDTLNKGVNTLNKGVKKIATIQVLNLKRSKYRSFTLPAKKGQPVASDKKDDRDLRIYIHEY